jgi:ABC-type Fe3+ transport system permease subunit
MGNSLAMFTSEATKTLLLFVLLFGVCMTIAAVNIVHFHHRRSRWQEALAAFAGAASLLLLGLYLVNYGLDGFQVLFQASASTSETSGALTTHSWLVYSALMALAGAMVCAFAGALATYSTVYQPSDHTLRAAHA